MVKVCCLWLHVVAFIKEVILICANWSKSNMKIPTNLDQLKETVILIKIACKCKVTYKLFPLVLVIFVKSTIPTKQ